MLVEKGGKVEVANEKINERPGKKRQEEVRGEARDR